MEAINIRNPAGGADPERISAEGAQAGVCFLLVAWSTSGCNDLCTSKEK